MKEYLIKWARALTVLGIAVLPVLALQQCADTATTLDLRTIRPPTIAERITNYRSERTNRKAEAKALKERFARRKADQVRTSDRLITEALNTAYNKAADGDYAAADRAYGRAFQSAVRRIKATNDVDGTLARFNGALNSALDRYSYDWRTRQRVHQYDQTARTALIMEMSRLKGDN